MGAALVIGVDGDEARIETAKKMGIDVVLDYKKVDTLAEIKRLTCGGAGVAIEALGIQETFEDCLRSLRPGGTLSSLGVMPRSYRFHTKLSPLKSAITKLSPTLCPGDKERMRRLMEMVKNHRVDLTPLITHRYSLDEIAEAYRIFGDRLDGVMKVVVKPSSPIEEGLGWRM